MQPSERPKARRQPRNRPHGIRKIETSQLVEAYLTAHEVVVAAGFGAEIDWQDAQRLEAVSESEFLREAAWVILSAGMRESVVRDRFGMVTEAFLAWESAQAITQHRRRCIRRGLAAFRHRGKIGAIGQVAASVTEIGFETLRSRVMVNGVDELQQLPFIGPVTRYHLAKNLGLDVVKPDRHLVRMACSAGFSDPEIMCQAIAHVTGDRLATVDLILWRFATLDPAYLDRFRPGLSSHTGAPELGTCAA